MLGRGEETATAPAAGGAAALARELRSWLASGALQGPEGAFHAWRDRAGGSLAFAYPEITGYALTWFAALPDATERELDAGALAGEWLADRIEADNLSARDGWDSDAIYNFDLGMIASGLFSFGRLTSADRLVDAGAKLVRHLHEQIQPGGSISSISSAGPAGEGRSGWSVDGEVHLFKLVQAFLLADAAGVLAIDERIEAMVGRMKGLQAPEGWFRTQAQTGFVMLHPHHYAIEGLWIWGTARGDDDALDRARLATEWAWNHQLPNGGLPRAASVGDPPGPLDAEASREQWDVTSQAIRAAVALGLEPFSLAAAVERLGEEASRGDAGAALLYQPGEAAHENAWASMFGAQAVAMASGESQLEWEGLV